MGHPGITQLPGAARTLRCGGLVFLFRFMVANGAAASRANHCVMASDVPHDATGGGSLQASLRPNGSGNADQTTGNRKSGKYRTHPGLHK